MESNPHLPGDLSSREWVALCSVAAWFLQNVKKDAFGQPPRTATLNIHQVALWFRVDKLEMRWRRWGGWRKKKNRCRSVWPLAASADSTEPGRLRLHLGYRERRSAVTLSRVLKGGVSLNRPEACVLLLYPPWLSLSTHTHTRTLTHTFALPSFFLSMLWCTCLSFKAHNGAIGHPTGHCYAFPSLRLLFCLVKNRPCMSFMLGRG